MRSSATPDGLPAGLSAAAQIISAVCANQVRRVDRGHGLDAADLVVVSPPVFPRYWTCCGRPARPTLNVFDQHLNGSHRTTFFAHGPERAFAIPAEDADALSEAVSFATEVWNGAGSLMLLVDEAGAMTASCESNLTTRYIDETWLHPRLTHEAADCLRARGELHAMPWNHAHQFPDFHPTQLLAPRTPGQEWSMTIPEFGDPALALQARVLWGWFRDLRPWSDNFQLGKVKDGNAYLALLGGQVGFNECSPLWLAQLSMRVFGQRGTPQPSPVLWIFEPEPSMDELVDFWNYRSSADTTNQLAHVVGLPAQALTEPAQLDLIGVWVRQAGRVTSPALLVVAPAGLRQVVEEELEGQGLIRDDSAESGADAGSDDRLSSYRLVSRPLSAARIMRGAWETIAWDVRDGRALITLPRPRSLVPSGGARIALYDIPVPLPLNQCLAEHMGHGCYARGDALGMNIVTGSPWALDLRIPTAQEALSLWATEYGYQVAESGPARDARALLTRLGSLQRLDALIDEVRLELLVQLAPTSQERLATQLAERWAPDGTEPRQLADAIRDKLRDEGLLLTSDAQTAEQLKSRLPAFRVPNLLAALDSLVRDGLIVRGRNLKCPSCGFDEFRLLRELDEHINCRGCGTRYVLPVLHANGKEAQVAYRIDPLTARVLERHVMPVLLTVAALRRAHPYFSFEHCWPGVIFSQDEDRPIDVDLVLSDGSRVFAAECKLDARGLETDQAEKLLRFTERTKATPVIAAVAGDFEASIVTRLTAAGGLVLTRADLLPLLD